MTRIVGLGALLAVSAFGAQTAARPEAAAPKAESAKSDAPAGPVHVKVGLFVLNIGKFDVATGTYTVDFYLDLSSDRDMGDQRFEFMNGRAASLDRLIDKPTEKFFRIQANLATNVDMRRYPWDSHSLPIILEPATQGQSEVVYEVDTKQSGIDPSVVFVGWDLKGYSADVRDHEYPLYNERYSQFVYNINISRLFFTSSLKTFMPVLCFLLISLVSLLIAIEKLDSRVTMNTAMLIAAVMFHVSIGNQLPPTGYLTIADKVMIATYAVIGLNLFLSVMMMRLMQLKRDVHAIRLRDLSFRLVPASAIAAYALVTMI